MHTEVFQIVHIVYLLPWLYCGQQSLKALLACLHTSMHGIVLSTDIYFPCKHTHTHTRTQVPQDTKFFRKPYTLTLTMEAVHSGTSYIS